MTKTISHSLIKWYFSTWHIWLKLLLVHDLFLKIELTTPLSNLWLRVDLLLLQIWLIYHNFHLMTVLRICFSCSRILSDMVLNCFIHVKTIFLSVFRSASYQLLGLWTFTFGFFSRVVLTKHTVDTLLLTRNIIDKCILPIIVWVLTTVSWLAESTKLVVTSHLCLLIL